MNILYVAAVKLAIHATRKYPRALQVPKTWIMQTLFVQYLHALEYLTMQPRALQEWLK